jgi:DNA-binding MarR family transcriptional regulator
LTNLHPDYPLGPPLIGALLRIPFETVRGRMLTGLHEAGFSDLIAAHLDVLQYPGPENRRPSDLAAETRMTKQAMNYLLGQMEQLGYLIRDDDPQDHRSKRIHLTNRGHAAARTIREIVRDVETDWEQQLGAKRFLQLREMLTQLQTDRPAPKAAATPATTTNRRRQTAAHPSRRARLHRDARGS